jgi:hypothetical protein
MMGMNNARSSGKRRGVGPGFFFDDGDAVFADRNNEIVVGFIERFDCARTTQTLLFVDDQRRVATPPT